MKLLSSPGKHSPNSDTGSADGVNHDDNDDEDFEEK